MNLNLPFDVLEELEMATLDRGLRSRLGAAYYEASTALFSMRADIELNQQEVDSLLYHLRHDKCPFTNRETSLATADKLEKAAGMGVEVWY